MKIIWVVLFIAYFFLCLQIARAKDENDFSKAETEMADISTSTELNNRIFGVVGSLMGAVSPSHGLMLNVVELIAETQKSKPSGLKIARYVTAIIFTVVSTVLKFTPFAAYSVCVDVVAILVDQVFEAAITMSEWYPAHAAKASLKIGDKTHSSAETKLNLEIIDKRINENFDETNPIVLAEKENPVIKEFVHFSKAGYKCDIHTCKEFGDGTYALGICSPYSCICSKSGAEERKCSWNMRFDPTYEKCDVPAKIKICGNNV